MSSTFFGHFQTYLPTPSTKPQILQNLPTHPTSTSTFSAKMQSQLNTFSGKLGK